MVTVTPTHSAMNNTRIKTAPDKFEIAIKENVFINLNNWLNHLSTLTIDYDDRDNELDIQDSVKYKNGWNRSDTQLLQ